MVTLTYALTTKCAPHILMGWKWFQKTPLTFYFIFEKIMVWQNLESDFKTLKNL